MFCQEYVILLSHIFLVPLSDTIYPKWSHCQHISKCVILRHLSNIPPKTTFHCMVLGAVLVISDVPPALVYLMLPHGNWTQLAHIHMYQVPFVLCWPWQYVLYEKSDYPLNLQFQFWAVLVIFSHPIWAALTSCMEIIPLLPVPNHQVSPYGFFLLHLTHSHCSHCQALHLDTNLTLVNIPTCCLQMMPVRSLFW